MAAGPEPATEIDPKDPHAAERRQLKETADAVVRECSTNARVAGGMRGALQTVGGDVSQKLDGMELLWKIRSGEDPLTDAAWVKESWGIGEPHAPALDSAALLAVLNIEPEEALSESGQERIEKKLSLAESA